MYLLAAALIILVLKLLELPPVGAWSWWWVVLPFVLSFLWFEFGESLFGFDKKQRDELDMERNRRARIRESLRGLRGRPRRK